MNKESRELLSICLTFAVIGLIGYFCGYYQGVGEYESMTSDYNISFQKYTEDIDVYYNQGRLDGYDFAWNRLTQWYQNITWIEETFETKAYQCYKECFMTECEGVCL